MQNKYEVKAKDKNEAIELAKRLYNLATYENFEIIEERKPNTILSFIGKKTEFVLKVKENNEKKILLKAKELLNLMDLNFEIEIEIKENNRYLLNLNGEDNGILIGKKGKTLNSFEYLLNSMIRNCRIEVDIENFKEKREKTVRILATKMAKKVQTTDKAVKLNPMPPKERRIIHEVLNTFEGLETHSEGKDPKRYIVIKKVKKNV